MYAKRQEAKQSNHLVMLVLMLGSQAKKIDTTIALQNFQQVCTNRCGVFDKNIFMLFAGIFFCCKKLESLDSFKKANRCLQKILGKGHSLISCMQFAQGKKAQQEFKKLIEKV